MPDPISPPVPSPWLIRIPEIFTDVLPYILDQLGSPSGTKLGHEYHLIRPSDPTGLRRIEAAMFIRWNMPVHHSWPCRPRDLPGFVEKAAQAVARKFAAARPQMLLVGLLDPSSADSYYRKLASNLRGRALQLFPPPLLPRPEVDAQDPHAATLFCLLGSEGLFCGLQSPNLANGFYPGVPASSAKIRRKPSAEPVPSSPKPSITCGFTGPSHPRLPTGSNWVPARAA